MIIEYSLSSIDIVSRMETTRSSDKLARKLCRDMTPSSITGVLDDNFFLAAARTFDVNDHYSSCNFQFPPPPQHAEIASCPTIMCGQKNDLPNSSDEVDTSSDSSQSDSCSLMPKTRSNKNALYKFRGYLSDGSPVSNILSILPPIGVFWDIENCQVPKGRSAVIIAQAIRDKFFQGYRETEFLVVCDVKKENAQVIQELNDAQVNLIHVSSQSKNAADDKLRQAMRRFADIHGPPAAIMLISGDINFSSDLCDLRHRKKIHVILLHNDLCSQSLILCANEHHNYSKLVETLPLRGSENLQTSNPVEVLVTNLPLGYDPAKIRNKLKRLSENCGGRVGIINDQTTTIRFSSMEFASRAQKRMNKERVFGNAVYVSPPYNVIDDQEHKNSGKEKMYHYYHSNGNKSLITTGNCCNVTDVFSNECRPHPSYLRSPHYPSGLNGHKNGRVNAYTNVNQENIIQTQNRSSWFWASNKSVCDNTFKSARQILGTCDGNTKCLPEIDSFSLPSGKTDSIWPYQRPPTRYYHQSTFNGQRNITPPVTILKRNTPIPSESHDAQIKSVMPANQFNGVVRRNSLSVADNSERYFYPISTSQTTVNQTNQPNTPVELQVTNLDQSMEPGELRKCLLDAFSEYTKVLNLSIYTQSDGNYAASMKVPNMHNAQFVISKLHHKMKIGFRRIVISYPNSTSPHNIALIKAHTVSLLLEVPSHQLPYFKFRELCEKRFKISPSLSDLHKIRDVCMVSEEANGRCISLHPDLRNSPSPLIANAGDRNSAAEQPYCQKHWQPTKLTNDKGWAELEISSLPNVKISLFELSKNVHHLVTTHNNCLLLASFCDCYETECGNLVYDDGGVALEHLVTCIAGIELVLNSSTGIKYLTSRCRNFNDEKKSDDSGSCISPSLANNLALFSRELVDLLKTFPHCMMPFNRFIPAYHHHFGRQCRVADYGYTKLIDLMEALPNVVQVIGDGNRRIMTLAHKAQIRRFTSDLLRVLKSLASKQTTVAEFPSLFEKILNRPFDPIDYGLCSLEDLLSQVSENTIVINASSISAEENNTQDTIIAIPKREQTAEEIERTKVFANEVVELLSHAPQCSMLFNKFIPAYHHHYGHQCKVSDFGFTKLIELFEAIPDIVKIEDDADGGDRKVSLKEEVKLKVLGDQLASLIMSHRPNDLSLANLSSIFAWQYGYSLKPSVYGFDSVEELIENLSFAIKIINTPVGPVLRAVDKNQLKFLALKVKRVLMECSVISQMLFKDFTKSFLNMFNETIELETLEKKLSDTVTIIRNSNNGDAIVKLTPLEIFARDVYLLLMFCDGKLPLNSFENAYLRMYSTAVQSAVYGYQTTQALLQAIPHTVILRGKPPKRIIMINTELASVGFHLPKGLTSQSSHYRSVSPKETADVSIAKQGGHQLNEMHVRTNSRSNDTNANATRTLHANEKIPPVLLPDLTLHPDTFTATPLTSPHKSLHNTIMFTEHMLHAPASCVEPPNSSCVPYPSQLIGYQTDFVNQQLHNGFYVSDNPLASSEDGSAVEISCSHDKERHVCVSMESSADSFSDGTVSSTNKRKVRLAAQFQGYSDD